MMRHNTNFSNTIDLEKNCSLKRQSEILKKKKANNKTSRDLHISHKVTKKKINK